jgi:hypothetical protein
MPGQYAPRSLSILCFALTSLFAPHCADDPGASADDGAAEAETPGVVVSAATWTLDWNAEGVDWDPMEVFFLRRTSATRCASIAAITCCTA